MKKVFTFLYFFICTAMLFSITALAYIDPSAMTYMIQLIAGIVIAAGAGFGFYFRRIRRTFSKFSKKDRLADTRSYDEDDDDLTGFGDYEIGDDYETEEAAGERKPEAKALKDSADSRPARSATASRPASSGAFAPGTQPSFVSFASVEEACTVSDEPLPAPDPYDETGGERNLLTENMRLRRLLDEERKKVELLKQALHICTAPEK
ncbi:MAG: hypothetical protein HFI38_01820 [Lachnospiraceae bacterium]|jgi:hypothetical protein|nr:hypothetical protein [Lachnospiraceae bacterium]